MMMVPGPAYKTDRTHRQLRGTFLGRLNISTYFWGSKQTAMGETCKYQQVGMPLIRRQTTKMSGN